MLTQGGPINATTTLSLFAYKIAFERCDFPDKTLIRKFEAALIPNAEAVGIH